MKYLVKIAKIIKFAFKGSKKNNHSIEAEPCSLPEQAKS
jgi:hypothetical protein